jgi:DNA-binding transcriptional LysR family regulator
MMMQKMQHNPAAKTQHNSLQLNINRLSWDDLRIFLACVSQASFRKAGVVLNLSSSTIVRRIERLESALGAVLFHRLPDGVTLTPEGRSIVGSARQAELAFFDIIRQRAFAGNAPRGQVKISISEGLGTYWMLPRLVNFQREYPFLTIDVNCAMANADVMRMEADVAIQFERPTQPDLIAYKLGKLHIYPFAAQSYIDTYGMPTCLDDFSKHRLVDQVAPALEKDAWAHALGISDIQGVVGIRTNSSTAVLYAVEKGAGIGALPTYALALGAPVVPIDVGLTSALDIWLTFHSSARKTERIRLVIDWIKRIFDPNVYPWFQNSFIHPIDLVDQVPREAAANFVGNSLASKPYSD